MKAKLFTIPNSLTLANLLCGAAGVVAALRSGALANGLVREVAPPGFGLLARRGARGRRRRPRPHNTAGLAEA
ncbi:MAG: hypothetical protein K2N04_04025 [Alistipes sp.]|nr:hypothetical protein [Alistipes sp.]